MKWKRIVIWAGTGSTILSVLFGLIAGYHEGPAIAVTFMLLTLLVTWPALLVLCWLSLLVWKFRRYTLPSLPVLAFLLTLVLAPWEISRYSAASRQYEYRNSPIWNPPTRDKHEQARLQSSVVLIEWAAIGTLTGAPWLTLRRRKNTTNIKEAK